jgi:hypothetical protein
MKIKAEAEVSLFVRDQVTGRLVFNSKAIEALGLCPAELAQRGYALDSGPPDDQLSHPHDFHLHPQEQGVPAPWQAD